MPEIITNELIEQNRTEKGGFKKKFVTSLGVPWPLQKGWKQRVIGKPIPPGSAGTATQWDAHWYAAQVRIENPAVKRGDGGGFRKIAKAAGLDYDNKRMARFELAARYGIPPAGWRPTKDATPKIKSKPKMVKKQDRRTAHVQSDDFLSSYEWKRVRMEVLIRDGRRCVVVPLQIQAQ